MIHALKPRTPKLSAAEQDPSLQNPTISHCWEIWQRVHDTVFEQHKSRAVASIEARAAFRRAMPQLLGYENICNFIACVTFGMNAGILDEDTGSKLLYAAQIGLNTLAVKSKIQSLEAKSKAAASSASALPKPASIKK